MTNDHTPNPPSDQERLIDTIAQDARVQVEAWMLPENRKLRDDEIQAVRDKVRAYMDANALSIAAVAKAVNYGPATVSSFLSAKYNGSNERIARTLNTFTDQHARGQEPGMPTGFVSTGIAERILGVMRHVQRTRTVGLVYGPAGISKSMCAQAAASGLIVGSVHLECLTTTAGPGALIRLWAKRLRLGTTGRVSDIHEHIIETLRDTDRLMIIDEAHYLSHDALNAIRDVHKQAGVGVVLLGTRGIDEALNDFREWQGQMERLISIRYDILEEHQQTGRPLFTVDEIHALAQHARLKLTGDAAQWLQMRASIPGWGGLGKAATLLTTARALAMRRAKTDTVDVADLTAAYRANEGLTHYQVAEHRLEEMTKRRIAVA